MKNSILSSYVVRLAPGPSGPDAIELLVCQWAANSNAGSSSLPIATTTLKAARNTQPVGHVQSWELQ